jgi:glycosyltransferase involved in cell wall biosynthesis
MTQPLISVVIPSYNSGAYIVDAVESALAQTYPTKEVIVIDDGSTDDTRARLTPWLDKVRYIHQANGGVSQARNRGIAEARGEAIAFLDADDQWLPTKLTRQWETLSAHSAASLVHTDVVNLHESTGERVYEDARRREFSGDCYLALFRGNRISPSSVLVKRNVLEAIGGFDEAIQGASTEDYDLWLRIARRYSFCYLPELLTVYRLHSQNATRQQRRMLENEYYVLAKTVRDDPSLYTKMGRAAVRDRLASVAFDAGYANVEAGDLRRARHYFCAATRCSPLRAKHAMFWLSAYLPVHVRGRLRHFKQSWASTKA